MELSQKINSNFDPEIFNEHIELTKVVNKYKNLESIIDEIHEMAQTFSDEKPYIQSLFSKIVEDIERLYFESMFNEVDKNNAIVTINSGAGGLEAQDWASMVFWMYYKWATKHNHSVTLLEMSKNDNKGIKSVDFLISGEYAYGYLKHETGVHRLVRNSPFDSNNARHTSFCSVFVSPEIDEKIEVNVKDSDLRIDYFCSSGSGGQNVNKVETAVRITHIPTKIVVSCQNERSQKYNQDLAMKLLRSKLYEMELRKRAEATQAIYNEMKDVSWGYQKRSYFLQPKEIIKDHETGLTKHNADLILNGNIDEFIEMSMKHNILKTLNKI